MDAVVAPMAVEFRPVEVIVSGVTFTDALLLRVWNVKPPAVEVLAPKE